MTETYFNLSIVAQPPFLLKFLHEANIIKENPKSQEVIFFKNYLDK